MANVELFQDDVALISGANKGIGYEIARGLGAKKIKVLVGARDEARGQAAVDKLKAEGADAGFIQLDVTDPEPFGAPPTGSKRNSGGWTS